ncbi:hypothetical protein BV25DRAFT_1914676 [Artomyces pyxidatus]|uniref:Uncharacterized protein n=1 Tax=Artomyces pyxidatus TaxID=48021 RepID=A0ACB8T5I4_9AGAM|nr:hypothetical protein BV25DRAFT_1914676 [Artomyces pyxidatus]
MGKTPILPWMNWTRPVDVDGEATSSSSEYKLLHSSCNTLFDAFVIDRTRRILWICQMTVAKEHRGSAREYEIIGQLRRKIEAAFKVKIDVKFVLVVPDEPRRPYEWHLPGGRSQPDVQGSVYRLRLPVLLLYD